MTLLCGLFNVLATLSVMWGWALGHEYLFRPLPHEGVVAPMVALTLFLATLSMSGFCSTSPSSASRLQAILSAT